MARHRKEAEQAKDVKYAAEARRFLEVPRGMADCTWREEHYRWLSRRHRTALQQTKEGRAALKAFESAPLLMDGRKDRVTKEVGANTINALKLERLSAETQKPIAVLRAYHDKPKTPEGMKMKPAQMDADDFRGVEQELLLCPVLSFYLS